MKNYALLIVLLFCFVFTIQAQTAKDSAQQNSAIKALIAKLEQENDEACVKGNKAVLERLYADNFVGITASGTTATRQEIIDFYAGKSGSPMEINSSDQTDIRVFDKTAIVTARLKYKYNKRMADPTVNWMRYTRIYVLKDDNWQIVGEHYSFITAND